MNPAAAKRLDMPDVLSRLGHTPAYTKKGGREHWYRSPFRKEKTPSFHITYKSEKQMWVWNDFGEGAGGNLLDFLMRYRKEGLSDVLKYLRTTYADHGNDNQQNALFPFHQKEELVQSFNAQKEPSTSTPRLELVKALPIQNTLIIRYLKEVRKIPKSIFQKYLLEIHYWNKDKNRGFFAFGMKNNSNGYEIRSASDQYIFKSVLNQRDITYTKGGAGGFDTVNIFEGMLDYLSALTLLRTDQLKNDSIILHSTSSYQQCLKFIQEKGYQHINTFLDNDATGRKCTNQFKDDFGDKICDQSVLFADYEDLNEALKNNPNLLLPKSPPPISPASLEVEP
ncbi:MAG: toprim domain-containing protein [Bacteroidota bacterium]